MGFPVTAKTILECAGRRKWRNMGHLFWHILALLQPSSDARSSMACRADPHAVLGISRDASPGTAWSLAAVLQAGAHQSQAGRGGWGVFASLRCVEHSDCEP
eukprot:773263-Amphidinium_carterae.2